MKLYNYYIFVLKKNKGIQNFFEILFLYCVRFTSAYFSKKSIFSEVILFAQKYHPIFLNLISFFFPLKAQPLIFNLFINSSVYLKQK